MRIALLPGAANLAGSYAIDLRQELTLLPGGCSDMVLLNEEQDAKESNPTPTVSTRPNLANGGFERGNRPHRQDAGTLQTLQRANEKIPGVSLEQKCAGEISPGQSGRFGPATQPVLSPS